MNKLALANLNSLIKIASTVYDMYPHQTYALRYNANNPGHKERNVLTVRDVDTNIMPLLANYEDTLGQMPLRNGCNHMSNQPYMGQYNLLIDRPNVEGTGHGNPLSRRPTNPQDYN